MSFNWSAYLDLAQELTTQAPASSHQEANLRCAVSRAYYAAFCKARNHLRDIDGLPVPHDGTSHRYVKEQFKKHSRKERRKTGLKLERMKLNRGKVDYDDIVTNLNNIALENLKMANDVISGLSAI